MSDINLNVTDGEAINLGVGGSPNAPLAMNTAIVVQGSGTDDYEELVNLPQINSVELTGNKTAADLGLANASDIVQEVFWATYGSAGSASTTTPAQLDAAIDAGKLLVCKYNNVVYQFITKRLVSGYGVYLFLAVGTNRTVSSYVQCQQVSASSYNWSHGTNTINAVIPSGGTTGQILKKTSNTDYATEWADESGGGGSSVSPYTSNPASLGTASAGSSDNYSRGDHVHDYPTDFKNAMLQLAAKVAYIDSGGQTYYNDLYAALNHASSLSVTNTLTNCTSSNSSATVPSGAAYSATITASTGYVLTGATVSITMGGNDITSTAYSNGVISIPAVTGALVITISAVAATVVSIAAVYTQSGTVYDTDSLDSLKSDLVVTATYDDSNTEVVTTYTLSGTLTAGTSTITVAYSGKTTTFSVTVTAWDFAWDYTMGKLEEQTGWKVDKSASNASSSLTSAAERITTGNTQYYQILIDSAGSLASLRTMPNGVGVLQVTFAGKFSTTSSASNFEIRAAESASNRVTVCENAGKFKLRDSAQASGWTVLTDFENDVDYTVRVVCKGTTADVYVNGSKVGTDIDMSTITVGSSNGVIAQAVGSGYYVDFKSLQLKVGSY